MRNLNPYRGIRGGVDSTRRLPRAEVRLSCATSRSAWAACLTLFAAADAPRFRQLVPARRPAQPFTDHASLHSDLKKCPGLLLSRDSPSSLSRYVHESANMLRRFPPQLRRPRLDDTLHSMVTKVEWIHCDTFCASEGDRARTGHCTTFLFRGGSLLSSSMSLSVRSQLSFPTPRALDFRRC